MSDFGISTLLPNLSNERVKELKTYLRDVLEVPAVVGLHQVTVKDLTDSKLLKGKAAGILVEGWQKCQYYSCSFILLISST